MRPKFPKPSVQFAVRTATHHGACSRCGSLVEDQDQPRHREWHAQIDSE